MVYFRYIIVKPRLKVITNNTDIGHKLTVRFVT
jgi:hypothetical protein